MASWPRYAGTRWAVRFEASEDWQVRIILSECTASEYMEVFGVDPPAASAGNRSLGYAPTPDRDVYPLCLEPETLNGAAPYDRTGQLSRPHRITRGPSAVASIYGRQWTPTLTAVLRERGVLRRPRTHVVPRSDSGGGRSPEPSAARGWASESPE